MIKLHAHSEALIVPTEDESAKIKDLLREELADIVSVCDAHKIAYTLCGGTCLGAIRHEGFIPWDDDIDINMPRSEFMRFKKVFDGELGDKYVLCVPGETDGYHLGIARVRRKGTVCRDHTDLSMPVELCGVLTDIFIYENVPDNPILRYVHAFGSMALGLVCSCRRFYLFREQYRSIASDSKEARKVYEVKIFLGRLFSFRSMQSWAMSWWNWNGLCSNESSKYLTLPAARNHYIGEMLPRNVVLPPAKAMFEGIKCSVPASCDIYLRKQYGADYMTPPPDGERERHALIELSLDQVDWQGRV